MTDWFVNDNVPVNATVTDATGTLEVASVTVTVKDPSGAALTVSSPTSISTGVYQAITAACPLAGSYEVRWEATVGGVVKGWVYSFTVLGGSSLPAFASPNDVAARWRTLSAAETLTAQALVRDASAVIRARFPGIDAQVTTGAVDGEVLAMVTAGMAKRAMIGGSDGVASQTEALPGGFSRGQTFANPLGNVFLTAADLVLILGYQPRGGSHSFANTTTKRGGSGDFVNLSYNTLTILP